jgi:uncharacterized protein YhfF
METDEVQIFWDTFCSEQPERDLHPNPGDVFAFGDSPEMASRLGELVGSGVKTATTSALWAYEPDEPLPQIGELSVVLGGDGEPLCIIETTEVRTVTFAEVDAAFAFDEGEGDRTLAYWRGAHERFFTRTLPEVGKTFNEMMPVVCERFEKVYPA